MIIIGFKCWSQIDKRVMFVGDESQRWDNVDFLP